MLDWSNSATAPKTLADLWRALSHLVFSMGDPVQVVKDAAGKPVVFALTNAAAGNVLAHGFTKGVPRAAWLQQVGSAAVSAGIAVGEIGARTVRVYATAACSAYLYIVT